MHFLVDAQLPPALARWLEAERPWAPDRRSRSRKAAQGWQASDGSRIRASTPAASASTTDLPPPTLSSDPQVCVRLGRVACRGPRSRALVCGNAIASLRPFTDGIDPDIGTTQSFCTTDSKGATY